jgi:hypothetical protein
LATAANSALIRPEPGVTTVAMRPGLGGAAEAAQDAVQGPDEVGEALAVAEDRP